jgi:hypothetical protein
MPKITKNPVPGEDQLASTSYASYILLTLVYYAKTSLKNNLWMKMLIIGIFLIFAIVRYVRRSPETEMIDGMEVPVGGDIYDLSID